MYKRSTPIRLARAGPQNTVGSVPMFQRAPLRMRGYLRHLRADTLSFDGIKRVISSAHRNVAAEIALCVCGDNVVGHVYVRKAGIDYNPVFAVVLHRIVGNRDLVSGSHPRPGDLHSVVFLVGDSVAVYCYLFDATRVIGSVDEDAVSLSRRGLIVVNVVVFDRYIGGVGYPETAVVTGQRLIIIIDRVMGDLPIYAKRHDYSDHFIMIDYIVADGDVARSA